MDEDDQELENFLADIEDVAAGRIIDMAHADLMMPLTEACTDLESELETWKLFIGRRRGMRPSIGCR